MAVAVMLVGVMPEACRPLTVISGGNRTSQWQLRFIRYVVAVAAYSKEHSKECAGCYNHNNPV
jgi:hypothetical protein